ncbi:hypothetical protein KJS94_00725 [Flavihumibacter rivuli]|uniref:hypothetical protein n=1 Tax=Flavihumibacter rivuli TaxID=2838156 RepID=UPI001BDF0BCA|nr:hypothetical protein [Flavihumibacter rivuli]ULQ56717.1 hypothetical protein KJS94_00725 [Flavihumibacter rivuli]
MSQALPYEQLIAEKLEQLPPLPEMADAIWARIEKQLDDEMPTDDTLPDNGPSGPISGSGGLSSLGRLGLLAIGAIILIYWLNYRKADLFSPWVNPQEQLDKPVAPENKAVSPGVKDAPGTTAPTGNPGPTVNPSLPVAPGRSDSVATPDSSLQVSGDSQEALSTEPVLPGNVDDSKKPEIQQGDVKEAPLNPGRIPDSSRIRKKPAGIKGIGPEDYKIVPQKKDSSGL